MKKIKLNKDLAFNKMTISKLNENQLSFMKGGGTFDHRDHVTVNCSCYRQSCIEPIN